MKKNEIAILSLKLLSIYAVIQSINQAYNFLYYLSNPKQLEAGGKYVILFASVPSILLLFGSIILWFGSPLIASKVFKNDELEVETPSSIENAQCVAFSVIGLFLLSTALPEMVGYILVTLQSSTVHFKSLNPYMVETILKVALGAWLLFGSRGFVNFLMYMNGKREKF